MQLIYIHYDTNRKWYPDYINKGKRQPKNIEVKEKLNIIANSMFLKQHPSMQYGVYVDFFDSVRLYIDDWGETTRWEWAVHKIPNEWWDAEHSVTTRQEARTKAIEKANEIYNERN